MKKSIYKSSHILRWLVEYCETYELNGSNIIFEVKNCDVIYGIKQLESDNEKSIKYHEIIHDRKLVFEICVFDFPVFKSKLLFEGFLLLLSLGEIKKDLHNEYIIESKKNLINSNINHVIQKLEFVDVYIDLVEYVDVLIYKIEAMSQEVKAILDANYENEDY